jgi:hypothetical protein
MTAILAAVIGCSENSPTAPSTDRMRDGLAPSFDRNSPTFGFVNIDVPGAFSTSPQGINASGDVSGTFVDLPNKHFHGFIMHGGSVAAIDTINYPGADYTDVRGIGPDGTVVGTFASNSEEAAAFHGFKRTPDGTFSIVRDPNRLYEIPQRILPDGTILGCGHNHDTMESMHGIIVRGGEATELDQPWSMNNGATTASGKLIVGLFTDFTQQPSGVQKAYTIENGVFMPFMVPQSIFTTAWDVNPRGDIVGVYRDASGVFHGYVRTAAGYTTLDAHPTGVTVTATRAIGINPRGDVVGTYVVSGRTHGFLMTRQ